MKNIVTRIAPSPTGPFAHIGNVRTLLYNYFLAKKSGGKFYVRLEDTDRDRYTASFLNYFKDMCDWLGIVPDGSYWNPDPRSPAPKLHSRARLHANFVVCAISRSN